MDRRGYHRYGVQGGDVGAFIAPLMGRAAPDRIIGVHVNALITFPTGDPAEMAALTEADRARLAAMRQWQERSGAYLQLQCTRPQTIAHARTDSPVPGQLHNGVRWSEFDRGGHFAALEAPDLLGADVRDFFRALD